MVTIFDDLHFLYKYVFLLSISLIKGFNDFGVGAGFCSVVLLIRIYFRYVQLDALLLDSIYLMWLLASALVTLGGNLPVTVQVKSMTPLPVIC